MNEKHECPKVVKKGDCVWCANGGVCLRNGNGLLDFGEVCEDSFSIIDKQDMCDAAESTYGNSYIRITEEDIQALRDGKVLFFEDGEYGTFVRM